MRYTLLTLTAFSSLACAVPAHADDLGRGFGTRYGSGPDNESPIVGKGAISVVHNEPASSRKTYTTEQRRETWACAECSPCGVNPCTSEQINRALQWLGRPEHEQIGHSRVLHDDGTPAAGTTKQDIRIRFH